jgi:hypothetical protein
MTMQFIKSHWISLASGVVALVGIVLAVIGMTRASVVDEMKKRMTLATEISSLARDPQNNDTIEAEKERGRKFEAEYENVVRTAESINERQPLMEGVFPEVAQMELPYRFRNAYRRRMWDLPHALKAGTLPSDDEIRDEAEIMADLEKRRQEAEGENPEVAEVTAPQPAGPPTGAGRVGPGVRGGVGPPGGPTARGSVGPPGGGMRNPAGGGMRNPAGGGMRNPAASGRGGQAPPVSGIIGGGGRVPMAGGRMQGVPGQTPAGADVPRRTPVAMPTGAQAVEARHRAEVKKARSIRIYADPDTSFHVSPIAYKPEAPSAADMWYAQVGLWVQEDLVNAIAQLNEEAAQQLAGKEVNVASMPVKRIESIRVLGYIDSNGARVAFPVPGQSQSGRTGAAPAGPTVASFTGRKADDQFDVVRLTLTAVVDERDLLKLIDAVTRSNFYQLVGLDYSTSDAVSPEGYLYGDAPVVRAVLDFEGYMARKIYKAMMPEEVLQALGIAKQEATKAAAPKRK